MRNISITNNRITNTAADSKDIAIQALRISDDLVITGNYMYGGYRGIEVQYSTGAITLDDNHFSGLAYQYVRILACGDNQAINLFTHGPVHCVLVLQIINTRLGQLRVKTVPSMAITVKMH